MRVFLVAAEASGDALGADLIKSLKASEAAVEFGGVGGGRMAEAGVVSAVNIEGLSVVGLFDGFRIYQRVIRAADAATAAAAAFKPDVIVLIDSWGFTIRVAKRLRKALPDTPLVKYIGPQVWATRAGRAKTLAAAVDHLICIHSFEPAYYAPYGLDCTVCGHPAIGRAKIGDGAAFRARHELGEAPLLLVLPGSRKAELRRVAPDLWSAAAILRERTRGLRLGLVTADGVAAAARMQAPAGTLVVTEAEKEDAFAAATLVLATSGTVTTEVALQGAPMLVAYRLGYLTYITARALNLYKARYISLLNIAADREIAREFVQTALTPEALVVAGLPLLHDPAARAAQVAAQNEALQLMGRGDRPASDIAAEAVLKVARAGRT